MRVAIRSDLGVAAGAVPEDSVRMAVAAIHGNGWAGVFMAGFLGGMVGWGATGQFALSKVHDCA
jgi:hypothetical protein